MVRYRRKYIVNLNIDYGLNSLIREEPCLAVERIKA